ncbi:hypothetical protein [Streptomyces sp. NPDC001642]|uniref:hypothetical protein n=1 Tax=Streptomyces sp. NPDC001642 TaxID=3154392 RepID=UPI0033322AE9
MLNTLVKTERDKNRPVALQYRTLPLEEWRALRLAAWNARHRRDTDRAVSVLAPPEAALQPKGASPGRPFVTRMFKRLGFTVPEDAGGDLSADRVPIGFTGRAWLVESFDRFLNENACGYFVLEASAGVGKTAFAAWLAYQRQYCSHFTSLAGGHEVVNAIQSIGRQLVREWNLDEFTIGGELPTNPGADWLEAVIEAAAERCRAAGRSLVIVVDGLDEAQQDPSGQPLGLPLALPDGVFVLATLRTGTECAWLRHPYVVRHLTPGDPENINDMRRHLDRIAAEPEFADLLSAAGVGTADFAAVLLAKCAGVWIYLRYVLEEVRTGLRPLSSLDQLPGDLWSYYSENVHRLHRTDEEWEELYLPLLATLGVAYEPVTPEMLARLAGLEAVSRIRRLLALEWRPFCETVPVGPDLAYSIYHQSLRDYLGGRAPLAPRGTPESARHHRETLSLAARNAHSRVADQYLAEWGGLDEGLPKLLSTPRPSGRESGYGLRNVPFHLDAAGRVEDLHRLLACRPMNREGQVSSNTWYEALNGSGDLSHFLSHVARARAAAERDGERARTDSTSPPEFHSGGLGLEIRYALILSSLASLAMNTPPQVIAAMTNREVWTFEQTIGHVLRRPNAAERVSAMRALAEHLAEPFRVLAQEEAVRYLLRVHNRRELVEELEKLLPQLDGGSYVVALTAVIDDVLRRYLGTDAHGQTSSPDEQILSTLLASLHDGASRGASDERAELYDAIRAPERMRGLLECVNRCQDLDRRGTMLAQLGPLLDHNSLALAVEVLRVEPVARVRASLLAAVVPRLQHPMGPDSWKLIEDEVLSLHQELSSEFTDDDPIQGLGWLCSLLPPAIRRRTLETALAWPSTPRAQAETVSLLLRAADGADRALLVTQLLEWVAREPEQRKKRTLLWQLPPLFEEPLRARVLSLVRDPALKLGDEATAKLLHKLVVEAPGGHSAHTLEWAVGALLRLGSNKKVRELLEQLVRYVDSDGRRVVVSTLLRDADRYLSAEVLADAANALGAEIWVDVLSFVAQDIDDDTHPAAAGGRRYLRARRSITRDASDQSADYWQGLLLSALAQYLPVTSLRRVVALSARLGGQERRAEVLAEVAVRSSAPDLPVVLKASRLLGDGPKVGRLLLGLGQRAAELSDFDTLGDLLAGLPARQPEVVAAVLTGLWAVIPTSLHPGALRAASGIPDLAQRARTLLVGLRHVQGRHRMKCFQVYQRTVASIDDERVRATVLIAAISQAPESARPDVRRSGLAALAALTDFPIQQSDLLLHVIPHLASHDLTAAAQVAQSISIAERRARCLAELAALGYGQVVEAELATKAVAALDDVSDRTERDSTAATLIARLPASHVSVILEVVQGIHDEPEAMEALAALTAFSAQVGGPLALQLLHNLRSTEDERLKRRVLCGLVSHLPDEVLVETEQIVRSLRDGSERARALVALAQRLPEAGRETVLKDAINATLTIQDEHLRAETLAEFPPELPEDVAAHIVAHVGELRSDWHQSGVLADMADRLTGTFLLEAFESARNIADQWCRARALAGVIPHLPSEHIESAAAAVRTIDHRDSRAYVWSHCIPVLTGADRQMATAEAVREVTTIGDYWFRLQVLLNLLPQFADPEHSNLLNLAMDSVSALPRKDEQARMYAALAGHASGKWQALLMAKGMTALQSIGEEQVRARTIVHMAASAPPGHTAELLTALQSIRDSSSRAEGLVGVASQLDGLRGTTFEEVLGGISFSAMLAGFTRGDALRLVGVAAQYLERAGGERAVRECVAAISDVTTWWP